MFGFSTSLPLSTYPGDSRNALSAGYNGITPKVDVDNRSVILYSKSVLSTEHAMTICSLLAPSFSSNVLKFACSSPFGDLCISMCKRSFTPICQTMYRNSLVDSPCRSLEG